MQTKVVLKAISPVGAPIDPTAGAPAGPPKHHAYALTFQAQDWPADGKVPPDYGHLSALIPFTVVVGSDVARDAHIGGEYVLMLSPAGQ